MPVSNLLLEGSYYCRFYSHDKYMEFIIFTVVVSSWRYGFLIPPQEKSMLVEMVKITLLNWLISWVECQSRHVSLLIYFPECQFLFKTELCEWCLECEILPLYKSNNGRAYAQPSFRLIKFKILLQLLSDIHFLWQVSSKKEVVQALEQAGFSTDVAKVHW